MKELSKETLNNLFPNIGKPFFYLRRKNSQKLEGLGICLCSGNFSHTDDLCLLGIWIYPDPINILWHSSKRQPISNYKNPRIDKLWKTANHHERNRRKIYFDFQRFLMKIPQQHSFTHPVVTPRQK